MDAIGEFLSTDIPEIRFSVPQGTYLAWIDASALGVSAARLQDALVHVGHVGIMNGAAYGDDKYLRMCVACPRSKLEEGLKGLLAGVRSL